MKRSEVVSAIMFMARLDVPIAEAEDATFPKSTQQTGV